MKTLTSSILALGLLAACAMTEKIEPTPAASGRGVVESIALAPESAAAGGTAGSGTKRVAVRMADGSLQVFETRAYGLKVGQRVELKPDGTIRHPVR